jgi:hypothetical protein
MRRSAMLCTLVALVLGAAALGCSSDGQPGGSLLVNWRVGGATCTNAGLEWVDVELLLPARPAHVEELREVWDVTRVRCDAGQTTFTEVVPGSYDVRVLGYPRTKTADGTQLTRADATYEGEALNVGVRSATEARLSSAIVLAARKGAIYLNWKFSNGMMCAYNGVVSVEITIYDQFSNADPPLRFACDLSDYLATLPAEEQVGGVRGVYIDKLDAEPLSVEAIGYDREGNVRFRGTAPLQVSHGEVRDLVVTLAPCAGSCS